MKSILKSGFIVLLLILSLFLGFSVYSQDVNPADNALLPFFGLAFPVLLWMNVILLIFLFIKKKVSLIIPLVALVYAWPSLNNYYQLTSKSEFSQADIEEIKLLTYNVRIFDANENIGGNTKDKIFSMISEIDANILCFQEFYYAEKKGVFDTKSILVDDLGFKDSHENFTHHMRGGLHAGVATFSKLPIINRGVISFESDYSNSCIYTDILIGSDTVRVYNSHLSSIRFQKEDYKLVNETKDNVNASEENIQGYKRIFGLLNRAYEKRAVQLKKVLDHIYGCPYPVVLAGDFNDTPVSYCYALTRKYLTDSFVESGFGVGNTYIGDFPSFRIDYIFHSDEIESADYRTLNKELSDHYPVYTKLRVKP